VNPTALHEAFIGSAGPVCNRRVDGRDKPGHDAKDRTSLRLGRPNCIWEQPEIIASRLCSLRVASWRTSSLEKVANACRALAWFRSAVNV
jgi:hypothetical protein